LNEFLNSCNKKLEKNSALALQSLAGEKNGDPADGTAFGS
jgi:hypothetical protein